MLLLFVLEVWNAAYSNSIDVICRVADSMEASATQMGVAYTIQMMFDIFSATGTFAHWYDKSAKLNYYILNKFTSLIYCQCFKNGIELVVSCISKTTNACLKHVTYCASDTLCDPAW